MGWVLRVQHPAGRSTVSLEAEGSTTCAELQTLIQQASSIPPEQQELLSGFPPKPVQVGAWALGVNTLWQHTGPLAGCMHTTHTAPLCQTAAQVSADAAATVASVGIANSDSLTVREKPAPPAAASAAAAAAVPPPPTTNGAHEAHAAAAMVGTHVVCAARPLLCVVHLLSAWLLYRHLRVHAAVCWCWCWC